MEEGSRQAGDQKQMSELQASDPNEATAERFVGDVLAAVELAFSEYFGGRWSPEINALYNKLGEDCVRVARELDVEVADVPRPIAHSRVLTNYRDRTR